MNSPLVGLQHSSDIRVELGIKEGAREHIVADNSTESEKSKLLGSQGGTPNPPWFSLFFSPEENISIM